MRVAITGASGFVGNRLVEKFHLEKLHEVTAIVRGTWGLALPARFDIDWKVCDHFEVKDLSRAFAGCEAVVHAALGAPYKDMAKAVYSAANAAGIRRVIVLSSASVYDQNPAPGTTEDSPLPVKPMFRYNAEKIAADRAVRRLRSRGRSEVVFLMPGIVYGPRSRWIASVANDVINGSAYLIRSGNGICNAVYIDNLVEAIRKALDETNVDNEGFFISDGETISWRDFYGPIVAALGSDVDDLPNLEGLPFSNAPVAERIRERVLIAAESKRVQNLKPMTPAFLKKLYKKVVPVGPPEAERTNPWEPLETKKMAVSLEMSMLQQCQYKLPNTKAERLLGYVSQVEFAEGMRRSIAWLEFAGFPILSKQLNSALSHSESDVPDISSATRHLPRNDSSVATMVETEEAR